MGNGNAPPRQPPTAPGAGPPPPPPAPPPPPPAAATDSAGSPPFFHYGFPDGGGVFLRVPARARRGAARSVLARRLLSEPDHAGR